MSQVLGLSGIWGPHSPATGHTEAGIVEGEGLWRVGFLAGRSLGEELMISSFLPVSSALVPALKQGKMLRR